MWEKCETEGNSGDDEGCARESRMMRAMRTIEKRWLFECKKIFIELIFTYGGRDLMRYEEMEQPHYGNLEVQKEYFTSG